MDSAGGTVTTGRDRAFQAVYKLRGKVLNTYGMELHKARKNNEVDDLISILRCGTGEDLVIENCKFNKLIVLADSDDDGKHIELLLTTAGHEYLYKLIDAGMFYIAISPLYKVSIPGKPVTFLNTPNDLARFFADQISSSFDFQNEGKAVTNIKTKANFVSKLIKYQTAINDYADKLNITPHVLESVLLRTFDPETGDLELGDRIEAVELANGNITLLGFFVNEIEEIFVSITSEPNELLSNIRDIYDLLVDANELELISKKGASLSTDSTINMIEEVFEKVKKACRISRLKGLGEINPDELWDTALNPETRRLVRVMPSSTQKETVANFMGKNPETRKEFLKKVFAEAIKDVMEV